MTDNYINFVAVEELFNLERESIQNDKSLDYPTKRMLVNELDRVWCYILQTPIRKIVSTDVKSVKRGRWIEKPPYKDETVEGLEFQIVCSECDEQNCSIEFDECYNAIGKTFYKTRFCPNCGADMRGEDIDNK